MKRILIIILLLIGGFGIAIAQKPSESSNENRLGIYVKVALPELAMSPSLSVVKENLLQYAGGAVEYKFRNKLGVNLQYGYWFRDYHNTSNGSVRTNRTDAIIPSLHYYLDQNSHLYLHIDLILALCSYQGSGLEGDFEPLKYWTNNVGYGLGYKFFLFKKKRFGLDFYARHNLFVRENLGLWADTPMTSRFDLGCWMFYRF